MTSFELPCETLRLRFGIPASDQGCGGGGTVVVSAGAPAR